ncbi:MAG: FAD-binding and (Fe-S)-binding domain-containing protein [Candidatus Sumerlaeaceae bacterium]
MSLIVSHPVLSVAAATSEADASTRNVNTERLATELRLAIEGEVRFDAEAKSLYAQDASNYRQTPIGVVIPRTTDDVIKTVQICRKHNAPLMGRGAGTSLAGQCCNVAVVIDFSKYLNKVIEFNAEERYAWVQPGIILDDLRALAETKHLTFGPDPATHDRCTMGGMIGNNSCGVHSVMAGRTVDNIEALDILLYDGTRMTVGQTTEEELAQIISEGGRRGELYAQLKALRDRYAHEIRTRFPVLPRRVSGFNLEELLDENGFHVARALVGTEGTCVTILAAKVKLVHSPAVRALLVLGYTSVYFAADHVKEILKHKPVGLEGMDDYLLNFLRRKQEERAKGMHVRPSSDEQKGRQDAGAPRSKDAGDILPPGNGWLLVEFGGESIEEAQAKCHNLMMELGSDPKAPSMKLMTDPQEEKMVWEVRKSGLGATAFLPGNKNTWPGWEDAAVPPVHLGEYLREFDTLRKKYQYECAMYGHFGDGCIHMRIDFDLTTREGIDKYLRFMEDAADLVVKYKGALSGEHGDGQTRAHLLPKMFGDELVHAFRLFKGIWDPTNRMNPGKVVDPYPPDSNLRLGVGYKSWRGDTVFSYAESDHSFGRALLRCVGVGKCRRVEGGTMCPSFMVTREEKHSTRGRAHLLADMLTGDIIQDGWKSEEVKESLDLCLACKGCKADCPVNVDMATYKAEFLYRYYQGRLRPMGSYAMGLIYWWARLSSIAPGLVNFFTQNPTISKLMKATTGIAQQRPMPKFARVHFKKWYARNRNKGIPHSALRTPNSIRRVILWSDTFNNYFTPETSRAALEVLEAAGFEVIVPKQALCCGRPLYDHGFLGLAKRLLREIMTTLQAEIESGIPIVGLEPSCVAVFRDEIVNLFEHEPLAHQLSQQTFTLAEFLEKYAPDWQPPKLEGRAVLHSHCHQKSVLTTGADITLLKKLGLTVETPDTGCCGMAGAFGFDAHNYDISVAIGERVLLPAAREAAADTLIITDGFSCREQVEQLTDRKPLHLAQVLQLAIAQKDNTAGPD